MFDMVNPADLGAAPGSDYRGPPRSRLKEREAFREMAHRLFVGPWPSSSSSPVFGAANTSMSKALNPGEAAMTMPAAAHSVAEAVVALKDDRRVSSSRPMRW